MIEAARAAGVVLMVGYPKRYDPAFARFREVVAAALRAAATACHDHRVAVPALHQPLPAARARR